MRPTTARRCVCCQVGYIKDPGEMLDGWSMTFLELGVTSAIIQRMKARRRIRHAAIALLLLVGA